MRQISITPNGRVFLRLWHAPYNAAWIWFSRKNFKRFSGGWMRDGYSIWFAVFGLSFLAHIHSWPWQSSRRKERLTYDHSRREARAANQLPEEIEVTPEMIEEGKQAWHEKWLSTANLMDDIALAAIYRAMRTKEPKR